MAVEQIDFVLMSKEFRTFYSYFDDFEFGGWQTDSLFEADGFETEDEAQRTIDSWAELSDAIIMKRTIHATFESV